MSEPLEMSIDGFGCADIFAGIVDIGLVYDPSMARDIVARFNACAGINTADLDRVKGDPTPIFELLMQTTKQRDDLLAALKEVVAISDRKHDAWDRAHAAIANEEQKP